MQKIKYKIYHFLTKEKVCPLLKPILDMKLNKSDIPKFDSKTIFKMKKKIIIQLI